MKTTFISFFITEASLEYHETLNEKLWENKKLNSDIREKLLKIAYAFIAYLDIPEIAVKDIVLCGGNANFSYTPYSDIDIHLVVNENEITSCTEYLDKYFLAKKTLWSYEHNITVKGYPVELYAQPITEKFAYAQGVYSLVKDSWIQEPTKMDINVNDPNLLAKVKEFKQQIDIMVDSPVVDMTMLKALKDKIKRMRKEAIQKAGEFSFGNLVFKSLRNDGYLDKMSALEKTSEDSDFSLK